MVQFFQGNAVWALVRQSDWLSTLILLTLLGLSIATWSTWIYHVLLFREKKRQLREASELLHRVTTTEEFMYVAAQLHSNFCAPLCEKVVGIIKNHKGSGELSIAEREMVQLTLDQALQEMLTVEERPFTFLRINADIGTLLGLCGTVWGLIHSFIRISERQSADIVTVAPGIAEALITTFAGLLVAVPALIMVHVMMGHMRLIEQQLGNIIDRIEWIVRSVSLK